MRLGPGLRIGQASKTEQHFLYLAAKHCQSMSGKACAYLSLLQCLFCCHVLPCIRGERHHRCIKCRPLLELCTARPGGVSEKRDALHGRAGRTCRRQARHEQLPSVPVPPTAAQDSSPQLSCTLTQAQFQAAVCSHATPCCTGRRRGVHRIQNSTTSAKRPGLPSPALPLLRRQRNCRRTSSGSGVNCSQPCGKARLSLVCDLQSRRHARTRSRLSTSEGACLSCMRTFALSRNVYSL